MQDSHSVCTATVVLILSVLRLAMVLMKPSECACAMVGCPSELMLSHSINVLEVYPTQCIMCWRAAAFFASASAEHTSSAVILVVALQSSDEHRIDTSNVHSRYIPWDRHDDHPHLLKFEGNAVSTAKYDRYFITFVFKFLFEMFSRVAYVYFLFQVIINYSLHVSTSV